MFLKIRNIISKNRRSKVADCRFKENTAVMSNFMVVGGHIVFLLYMYVVFHVFQWIFLAVIVTFIINTLVCCRAVKEAAGIWTCFLSLVSRTLQIPVLQNVTVKYNFKIKDSGVWKYPQAWTHHLPFTKNPLKSHITYLEYQVYP